MLCHSCDCFDSSWFYERVDEDEFSRQIFLYFTHSSLLKFIYTQKERSKLFGWSVCVERNHLDRLLCF